MPIFPTYQQFSSGGAIQTNPSAPSDPRPKQIEGLGQAVEKAGTTFAVLEKKKRELVEDADVMDRASSAVADMEAIHETLNTDQNAAIRGKTYFDEQYKNVSKDWYKGLSPRAQNELQHKLYGRTLEYRIGAGKIENRAVVQVARGALDRMGQAYVDVESRRIDPSDASSSWEHQQFIESGNKLVADRAMTPEEWANKQQTVLSSGAYSRAHKIIASDNPEEIKHFLGIAKESRDATDPAQDPTFLKHMKPEQREALVQMGQARIEHLRAQAVAAKNQEWTDTHRQLEEQQKAVSREAYLKLDNPQKYGTLTRDWVERMDEVGLIEGPELSHLRQQAENLSRTGTAATGGFGNAAVINRWSIDAFSTKSPEQALAMRGRLIQDMESGLVPGGPGSVGSSYLQHLTALAEPKLSSMTIREQTARVKELIMKKTTVSGPAAQFITPAQRAVQGEALEMLDKNMLSDNPVSPMEIHDKYIANWQARLGQPAQAAAGELARSQGLPYTSKGDNTKTFLNYGVSLQKQYESAPPGPAGDAIRRSTLDQIKAFRRLQQLDAETKRIQGLKEQAKSGREQQKQESAGGPLTGPRK